jgi:integrase/recombinase XerD
MSAISGLYEYLVFEDRAMKNPVPGVRKRYLHDYKTGFDVDSEHPRKLLTVEEMSMLINSVVDTRDKAIMTLLAKTGVRRGELISMDLSDVDWVEQSITLKPFRKRSNRVVFFDDETARILKRWLGQREKRRPDSPALFIGEKGDRLKRHGVYSLVVKHAEQVGLHKAESPRPEDHFSVHNFRHWNTTHLRRMGMPREFIKALRGDRRREAIDIYDRIDRQELKRAYLAFIPQLAL